MNSCVWHARFAPRKPLRDESTTVRHATCVKKRAFACVGSAPSWPISGMTTHRRAFPRIARSGTLAHSQLNRAFRSTCMTMRSLTVAQNSTGWLRSRQASLLVFRLSAHDRKNRGLAPKCRKFMSGQNERQERSNRGRLFVIWCECKQPMYRHERFRGRSCRFGRRKSA
jgi:hypothetical protein